MVLFYPNNIKKKYTTKSTHANRGMDLEYLLEKTNEYYLDHDIAYIYKKPTPIGIVKVNYDLKKIEEAYFQKASTLDYNGLYNGYYIEFDAKETKNKNYFPLANVHPHQVKHIRNIIKGKGIVFLLIMINDEYYVLNGPDFIAFVDNEIRKSIPYEYIKTKGYELKYNFSKGLDYLSVIDKLIGDGYYGKEKVN